MTSSEVHPYDRIVVVHGFDATPADNWFPWLAETLPGVERIALPTPGAPEARTWIPRVVEALEALDAPRERVAIVAHSLGCLTAARAVAALHGDERWGAFVAVAPFAEHLPHDEPVLDAFMRSGFAAFLDGHDPAAVRRRVRDITVIRSDDDPTVPAAASDRFAAELGAEVRVVSGAGHFCADEGVTRLPAVVDALRPSAS